MNRKQRYIIGGSLILAVLLLIVAYRFMDSMFQEDVQPSVQVVQTSKVSKVMKEAKIELYGSIDAVNKISVSSKVAGRVRAVNVDNGQAVTAGETLIVLEDEDYRNLVVTSTDTLKKAQLQYDDARDFYKRCQELFEAGAIAKNDMDKARLAMEAAEADLNSARAGLDNAQKTLNDTIITAPFAGVIASRAVDPGQIIAPGVSLMALADISEVYAIVNVSQEDLLQLKPGLPCQIILDNRQEPLSGEVSLINPLANQARMFEVKVKINNKDGLLKPGMFVKTIISLGSPYEVLAVPQGALSGKEGAYYVFVVKGDRARQTAVQIGATLGENIEIKSGLNPGEQVIVTNVNKLKDDDLITVSGQ